jgi:hypothetical protein
MQSQDRPTGDIKNGVRGLITGRAESPAFFFVSSAAAVQIPRLHRDGHLLSERMAARPQASSK